MKSLKENAPAVLLSSSRSSGTGSTVQSDTDPICDDRQMRTLLSNPQQGLFVVAGDERELGLLPAPLNSGDGARSWQMHAYCPPLDWRGLGDRAFCQAHQIDYAYMCGAMANGIASAELVAAAASAGVLASYGAAGQSIAAINEAIDFLEAHCADKTFAINLIHSPNEPEHEGKVVDLFLQRQVRLIEASAYMGLTPAVVRYRLHGLHRNEDGQVVAPNKIIAKASRIEVARKWWNPAPEKIVQQLLAAGQVTAEEAALAAEIPMAHDLTAESDSGGHTDNRPALCMFPTFLALRDELQQQHKYYSPLRLGLGGGIGTPAAAAAAFSMGAAYIVTGSINQACTESGSSAGVRKMLAEAEQADVCMAPAADMFEMGVKLQVLKRGTFFPMRAEKLFQLYKTYDSIELIPAAEREQLEKQYFRSSIDDIWQQTERFFNEREPKQIEKAVNNPKHKMALIFRWYLGKSSRWANSGDDARQMDYQVWCGPAMGAFNQWAKDSFLESAEARDVKTVAWNILHGCCQHLRLQSLRQQGIRCADDLIALKPQPAAALEAFAR